MKTIRPESIALFCLSSGDIELAKHLAEVLPMTCFIGKDWQQGFLPLVGGSAQSLSDAYTDYSVVLLIAENGVSTPESLYHPDGATVILIAEHHARLLAGPAGEAVALIQYLNEMCQCREIVANDAFCRTLTREHRVISQRRSHS
ncbi:TPA: cobalamin biosynthesis protein [Escherichia coli]|nr:cobalamin biosynthesis protein [Escherichia coli]EHD2969577.1 cobalamin biosynthesis protein [Escherichia coli]EKJ3308506.1 cobalamin biosynthesis protein [Escherichia coli]EKM4466021.1 cobalamin biosynthesis protein [Escherichia coli]NJB24249.1 cobalamin biosynthesis protein [Escherichia coli]